MHLAIVELQVILLLKLLEVFGVYSLLQDGLHVHVLVNPLLPQLTLPDWFHHSWCCTNLQWLMTEHRLDNRRINTKQLRHKTDKEERNMGQKWPSLQLCFCLWGVWFSLHTGRGGSDQVPWRLSLLPPTCSLNLASPILSYSQSNTCQFWPPQFPTLAASICTKPSFVFNGKNILEQLQEFCNVWASGCERWRHLADGRANRWHGARLATGRRPT